MNTDTTEPAKTLGQVAFETRKMEKQSPWKLLASESKERWERSAQAVLQQFLSAGPVSAEDIGLAENIDRCQRAVGPYQWGVAMAAELNAILAARHANPVQAEGGWEEFEEATTVWTVGDQFQREDGTWGDIYPENVGAANGNRCRRIPTVQPAVASGSPKDSLVPQEPKQAVVADDVVRGRELIIQAMQDRLDMNRDEFQRILALKPSAEIVGICERAETRTTQTVPLIIQRDRAIREMEEYKSAIMLIDCRWGNPASTPDSIVRGLIGDFEGLKKQRLAAWEEAKCFIKWITLQVQIHASNSKEDWDSIFKECYRNYVRFDVENLGKSTSQQGPPANPTAAQGHGGTQKEREGVEVAAYRREVEKWKANYVEVHDQLTASQARVAEVQKQYNELYTDATKADAQAMTDLEAMKVLAQRAEEDRAINEKHWGEQLTTLRRELKDEAGKAMTYDAELSTLRQQADKYAKEITALRQERDRSDQDWANAKKECESLRFQLTEANRVLAEARKEVERLKEELDGGLSFRACEKSVGKALAVQFNKDDLCTVSWNEMMSQILQLRSRGGVLSMQALQDVCRQNGVPLSVETSINITNDLNTCLTSPWRTIIAGDPASLPQIGDADRNGFVMWLFPNGHVQTAPITKETTKWLTLEMMPTDWAHTNLPPLPTPKASAEDDGFEKWFMETKYAVLSP